VEELSFVTQRGYVDKPLNRVPSLLVVPRELKVVALAGHADGKVSDASPGVQPCAESMKGSVIREHGAPGEADSRTQELAALVEHISRLPDPPEPWDAD
jgi:hypothetical protein